MLLTVALAAALATVAAKPGVLPGGTRPFEPIVIEQDSNPCPQDLSHHLLPHESDCAKFYYCEYGVKWETARDCAPGTHFSYELQVCVHPSVAGCTVEDFKDEDDSTNDIDDGNHADGTDEESENEIDDDNIINEDNNNDDNNDILPENDNTDTGGNEETSDDDDDDQGNNDDNANIENGEEDNVWLDNGCPANWHIHWLLPHESDCSKFYQCNFGELVEKDCAPGTHFNSDIQVCDHPENVICSAGDSNNNSNENDSNDDNSTNSESDNETSNGDNDNGIENPDNNDGNDNENNTNNDNDNNIENGETDSEWLDNGCPANWHIHWLLPHESDCSKFYQCNFGELVEKDCAPRTHFNALIQVCDHPENVKCSGGESNDDSNENDSNDNNSTDSESDNETGNGDNDNGIENPDNNDSNDNENNTNNDNDNNIENDETDSEWLDNGCPANWHIHWLLPHESDCSKFYQCNFRELVEKDCAPGTHFNADIQVCDHPGNVKCSGSESNDESNENDSSDDNNTDSESDNETGNGDNDNSIENPDNNDDNDNENNPNIDSDNNTENDDSDSEWLDNGCPANWHIHWLLPHASDCSKFYQCDFGELVEKDCAPGTYFDPTIQVCDHPENVNCSNNEVDDNNNSIENDLENDANDNNDETTEVDEENDNGNNNDNTDYDSGNEDDDNNDVDGDDDDDTNNGDSNTDVDEGENNEENEWLENGCPADWSVHWLLPHETDCVKFYYCFFGQLVERYCAQGTVFNPVLQVCDDPKNVNCTTNDDDSSNDDDAFNDDDASNDDNASNEEDSSNDDNDAKNRCKRCEPGFWAHRSDCEKFWRCVKGKPTLSVCSEGLYFNAATQTCDFQCNVECVKKNKITTTARKDGLKIFIPWDKIDNKQFAASFKDAK